MVRLYKKYSRNHFLAYRPKPMTGQSDQALSGHWHLRENRSSFSFMNHTAIPYADTLLQVGEEYLIGLRSVVQLGNNIVEIPLLVFLCKRTSLTQMVDLFIAPLHDGKPVFITQRYNGVISKMLFLLLQTNIIWHKN